MSWQELITPLGVLESQTEYVSVSGLGFRARVIVRGCYSVVPH